MKRQIRELTEIRLANYWKGEAIRKEIKAIVKECGSVDRMHAGECGELRGKCECLFRDEDECTKLTLCLIVDLKKRSKLLAYHLRDDPMDGAKPTELTELALLPLWSQLVSRLVDSSFRSLKAETSRILCEVAQFLEKDFTAEIELDNESQVQIAQQILSDEKKRFVKGLRRAETEYLDERIKVVTGLLQDELSQAIDGQLGILFDKARKLKQKRGVSTNANRLNCVEDGAGGVAESIGKAIEIEARTFLEETAKEVEKKLVYEFDQFTERFQDMGQEDVRDYVGGESLAQLKL
jgi:hypothetical protein